MVLPQPMTASATPTNIATGIPVVINGTVPVFANGTVTHLPTTLQTMVTSANGTAAGTAGRVGTASTAGAASTNSAGRVCMRKERVRKL